jgi:hypothetical protein
MWKCNLKVTSLGKILKSWNSYIFIADLYNLDLYVTWDMKITCSYTNNICKRKWVQIVRDFDQEQLI